MRRRDRTAAGARAAVRAHFDGRAATYDESSMHRGLTEAIADWLDDRGERYLLDVATGTGLMLRSLGRRRPGVRQIGVDIAPGMLAVARAALPGAVLVCADAARLPLRASSVDLMTCITALHLLPDATAAVSEWARVLRPTGRLVTATFADAPSGPVTQQFPRRHADFRSTEQLAALVAPVGLTVERHAHWAYTDEHGRSYLLQLCVMAGREG